MTDRFMGRQASYRAASDTRPFPAGRRPRDLPPCGCIRPLGRCLESRHGLPHGPPMRIHDTDSQRYRMVAGRDALPLAPMRRRQVSHHGLPDHRASDQALSHHPLHGLRTSAHPGHGTAVICETRRFAGHPICAAASARFARLHQNGNSEAVTDADRNDPPIAIKPVKLPCPDVEHTLPRRSVVQSFPNKSRVKTFSATSPNSRECLFDRITSASALKASRSLKTGEWKKCSSFKAGS